MTDREALVATLYGEARGEPVEGRIAVACVLKNRRESGRWGRTFAAVALAPLQFSCWNENDPNCAKLRALVDQMAAGAPLTEPVLIECDWIASGILSGAILGRVGESTHYHAAWMKQIPSWAVGQVPVCRVGQHMFYSHIR
jgi:N-acetylmuramoyl-L-alanine amidase